jgi:hypothetical protein
MNDRHIFQLNPRLYEIIALLVLKRNRCDKITLELLKVCDDLINGIFLIRNENEVNLRYFDQQVPTLGEVFNHLLHVHYLSVAEQSRLL